MSKEPRDPFEIDGIDYVQVVSTSEMNESAKDILAYISEDVEQVGASLPTYLLAQAESAKGELANWAAKVVPYGIKVATYDDMIEELWDVYGDGRKMARQLHIRNVCRRAYREATGQRPSSEALDLATGMINMCVASNDARLEELLKKTNLPLSLSVPAIILSRYEEMLSTYHMVDPRRAASILSEKIKAGVIPAFSVIAEDPSENDASQYRFYAACADVLDIHVIRRDGSDQKLEPGRDGLDARFAVAYGAHAQPRLLSDTITDLHSNGVDFDDIAVAVPKLDGSILPFLEDLATRDIPFECTYQVPATTTATGHWFEALETLRRHEMIEVDKDAIVDKMLDTVVASPHSFAPDDKDLAKLILGSAFGLNEKPQVEEENIDSRFLELAKISADIMDPSTGRTSTAWLDLTNRKHTLRLYPETDPRQDEVDRIGAAIQLNINECKDTGDMLDMEDLAQAEVSLTRTWGQPPAVQIVPYVQVSYEDEKHMVAIGMDSKSLSGYSSPSPFSRIMEELGSEQDPWVTERPARLQILDMMRKATGEGSITFMRSANDRNGNELPPAPLYTELCDELGGIGSDGFPKGIDTAKKRSLSEAEIRFSISQKAKAAGTSDTGISFSGVPMDDFISKQKNGKPHRFSPTDLELYWACPRKWFAGRNGTGYSDTAPEDLFDPRSKGSIIHETLNRYYRVYGKDHPRADLAYDDDAAKALEEAFSTAVKEKAPWLEGAEAKPSEEFALFALGGTCRDMIERDQDFLPGFSPWLFEKFVSAEIAGVEIGGIIDRIDARETEDGKLQGVIVDYKGSPDSEYAWPKGSDVPALRIQGLIYAELAEAFFPNLEIVGVVYRGYSNGEDKGVCFVPLYEDSKPIMGEDAYRTCRESFKSVLIEIISGIVSGEFPAKPRNNKKKACDFCNAQTNCPNRIRN